MKEIKLEQVEEFYYYLTGVKIPEGMMRKSPKLSEKMAFNIIWYLQEHLYLLPNTIERCYRRGCGQLFDRASSENNRIRLKFRCDACE